MGRKGILNRDVHSSSVGQLVLIRGSLRIKDLGLLEKLWDKPAIKKSMRASEPSHAPQQNRATRRAQDAIKPVPKMPTGIDMFQDMISALPHTIQAEVGDDARGWCILRPEGLTGISSDFALMFGGSIPGSWALVGILDAKPDAYVQAPLVQTTSLDQAIDAILPHLETISRQFLGRPATAFGVTPLAIFRQVGG